MSKTAKLPLIDILEAWCVQRGLRLPRENLLAAIICGDILASGERCRNPKQGFNQTIVLQIAPTSPLAGYLSGGSQAGLPEIPGLPFVSRGGDKLDSILVAWDVKVSGRIWLDAGCSTGGFSHCLLLHGAQTIHAVDVGYNLLHWRLRNLPQLVVHERCNIMGLESLAPVPDAAVADLSFRSMQGAARKILSLVSGNELYALIKPQFERKYRKTNPEVSPAAAGQAGIFKGVVDPDESNLILEDVARRLAGDGIAIQRICKAGLRGRSGNQEYIAQLGYSSSDLSELQVANLAQIRTLTGF